jgi:poly(glycerol-phosphate) alpha-glucosyltransferase
MLDGWALARSAAHKPAALAVIERAHLTRATVTPALTAAEAAAIRAAGCRAPIAVIPNGIDMPAAAPARLDPSATAAAATAARDPRNVLLFLGRLHPKKGVAELIAGWAKAVALDPALAASWRLQLSGWDDGSHLGRLLAAAARSGVAASISFTGPLTGTAKIAAYARANAFILPSASEGLPMTILEAWSHGLPVFATAACNIPDGFANHAAIAIDRAPDTIAATLVATHSDCRRLAATGAAGRRLATERYAWAPIAARWQAVYAWAAGRAPPPADILPAPSRAPPPPVIPAMGRTRAPSAIAAAPDGAPASPDTGATPDHGA